MAKAKKPSGDPAPGKKSPAKKGQPTPAKKGDAAKTSKVDLPAPPASARRRLKTPLLHEGEPTLPHKKDKKKHKKQSRDGHRIRR